MHFQPDLNPNLNTITACGKDAIKVNHAPFASSIWIAPEGEVKTISAKLPTDLNNELFSAVLSTAPEVVLIGTGTRQHFIHPAKFDVLTQARVGVECMSSDAACRTFNVLMSEGRHVVAIILLPSE